MEQQEKKTVPFSWRKRAESFRYAFKGLASLIKGEHNARIHLAVAICVIIAGLYFGITRMEWMAVAIVIGAVFTAEAFNSAIELLCDHVTPEYSPTIKTIKDLAAGAVLLSAIAAAAVGLIVFIPHILNLFST